MAGQNPGAGKAETGGRKQPDRAGGALPQTDARPAYDIEQEQTGKQDKESAGPDCATICRPQDFFLNMSRTKRKRKLVEWLESCQENQVNVLDEKIPLLSFAVDFVTAYEYQKARGIKIHPGLWKDMRVDIFLVKKEN